MNYYRILREYLEREIRKRKRLRIVAVLGILSSILTNAMLTSPADTLTGVLVCGQEEHTHTEECYQVFPVSVDCPENTQEQHLHDENCYDAEGKLVCGKEEFVIIHTHDEECYDREGSLICHLPVVEEHIHSEECYDSDQNLVCQKKELRISHTHDETCYDSDGSLICTLPENEAHEHTEECYDQEQNLICGIREIRLHPEHTDACYETDPETGERSFICPYPVVIAHQHTGICHDTVESVLVCTEKEHVHTDSCYEKAAPMPAVAFENTDTEISVFVSAEEGCFPEGTEMLVKPVSAEEVMSSVETAVGTNIVSVQAVDISFWYSNTEIQPLKPISVLMRPKEPIQAEMTSVVHVADEGEATVVQEQEGVQEEVLFDAPAFSVYVLVGTTIEKTVLASDGKNYQITVTYGPDAELPEDTDLHVTELKQGDEGYDRYLEESALRLDKETADITYARIFDISLVSRNDTEIHYQPEADVSVSIQLIDADENRMDQLKVLHISGDRVDVLDASAEGNVLNFVTGSFSIYPIVDDDGENARIGYRFWYNDGSQDVLLTTQYFRYKDVHPGSGDPLTINEPGIPGIESATWNRIFRGWSTASFTDTDENLKTIEDLNDELSSKAESEFTEGTFIDVYANLKDVYYITYVDVNPNNILATEIVPLAESGDTTFTVKQESSLRPTIDADTVLQGWYDIEHPETIYAPGQENVAVSSSMTLYPKIEGGSWLIFNDNDPVWDQEKQEYVSGGASFTPPAFYLNETTQEPADPTWAGYEFGGWYTDSECTTPFEFGNTLSHDTTVYAKWIPSDSQYRVIIWKQRTSNSAGLSNDEKTYDYVTSYLIDEDVSTGDIVSLENQYKNIYGPNGTSSDTDKAYFIYNGEKTDQSVVVKADGSSVLNVYYDRKPVTLNYYTWDYGYTPTTGNGGTQYGLVDGEYVQLTRNGNTWTYVTGTEYTYNLYTGTSSGDYYIPDGSGGYTQVHLYRNNNRWYRNRTWSLFGGYSYSDEYTGNVYTRSERTITETYTGTRYTRNNNRSWQLYKSFTGLYGSTLAENGYSWPEEYDWYSTGNNNGGTSGTRTTFMSAFLPTDVSTSGSTVTVNFYGASVSGSYHIHFLVQNLDGTYTERDDVAASGRSFYISDKYIGYHAYQYRADNGNWTGVGRQNSAGYYNNGNTVSFTNNLYIRFNLNDYTLTFYTNNGSNQVIDYTVPYSKSLSEYAGQNEGQRNGYYFLGWYADPSCTEPFDFTQTMPDNNVAVYGKWRKERFRIVIEPGANNVYIGSQATRFRLDYDETIDGGLLEAATRAGYILDGWYTDPDFTNRFLFSNPVNASTPGVDMTYQTSPAWAAARAAYGDDDEEHENVRGILHLYAKWIPDTDSTGINVVYDAGDAALYDSLGSLLTTVPIDTHMYGFDGTATGRESPSNYNDLYTFKYWEATKEDGTKVTIYPGDPVELAELTYSDPVYDENGDLLRKTVTLRAVYDQTGDPSRITHITYNGDTISYIKYGTSEPQVLQGKTRDGTNQITVTLNEEINQTIVLPDENDFYLNGYTLVGWSFFEGSYEEQTAALAEYNAQNPDNQLTDFSCGQEVAADNLDQGPVNDRRNTLYAMWQPKEYTVTVRQVVENGVPQNTFAYAYKTGEEAAIGSMPETVSSLTGNSSFSIDGLEYYDRTGDVIRITDPDIPDDAIYSVRVNAIVTKDDGTTEILNPTAAGDYQILGDVVITYTYSLNVPVKFQKRDATDHTAVLIDAVFTVTPVEFNSSTQHWEIAGAGQNLTVDSAVLEKYLQEGTYRIEEITAPDNYAKIEPVLYLTVKKDEPFTLFAENGSSVNPLIAELDPDGKILTVYDNPIRTVTLSKTVEPESEDSLDFRITVYNDSGGRLGNYVIGTVNGSNLVTNNIGEASVSLRHGGSIDLNIPHGSRLTVEELQDPRYEASYIWNSGAPVNSRIFGSEPVSITADSVLAYTNTPSSKKLRIHKNGNDAADGLAGAHFDLTGSGAADFEDMTDLVSMEEPETLGYLPGNDDTDTTLFTLPVGNYILRETDPPQYYDGIADDVSLRVTGEEIRIVRVGSDVEAPFDGVQLSEPDEDGVYTLSVTNTRKKASVTIVKNVIGTDADKDAEYSFTVTGLTESEDTFSLHGRQLPETVEEGEDPVQTNTKVYSEIPYGTVFSAAENDYPDFDTEIVVRNGETDVTKSGLTTGDVTVEGDVTVTYTNTRNRQPVKVFKYETGTSPEKPLAGAVFSLSGPEGTGISYTELTTDNDGYLVNENGTVFALPVNSGAYTLTETHAPAGYLIIGDGNTQFTVSPDHVSGSEEDTSEGVYVIKVQNSAGTALPHTGGAGTILFYLFGIMLTAFAGTGIAIRKKKTV